MRLVYYSADGSRSVILGGDDSPYLLLGYEGLLSTLSVPQTTRGPGQTGVTLLDAAVEGRTVALQLLIVASSAEELWQLRQELAAALATPPARHGQPAQLGAIRLERDGQEALELPAVPRGSPAESKLAGVLAVYIDVEFYCPEPYWQAVSEESALLATGGAGFSYPFTYPLTYPSNSLELEVVNRGSVDAPPLVRIYGQCVDPRISNLSTGEALRVMGTVNAGDYLEIETAYGRKSITYVASSGTRTNWLDHLDLQNDSFWHLRPGVNRVRFDVASGTGHKAIVIWRPRWAGV